MTSVDPSFRDYSDPGSPFAKEPSPWWVWIDDRVEGWGEFLNPILVKEARQSLKSRQFVITFFLLLICAVVWSVVGVYFQDGPDLENLNGRGMLTGFFLILAFPLTVIVPFSTFRSLAGEREDGTFELMSITTLSSRQIISGKLASGALQMMIYLSVLTPCIALSYLLRGVDLISIGLVLFYAFGGSLLLCFFSIMIGAITQGRQLQSVMTIFLVLAFLIAFWFLSFVALGVVWESEVWLFDAAFGVGGTGFWAGNACAVTIALGYMALFFETAAARIAFVSDNRSSRLRYVMLGQSALLVGWCVFYWIVFRAGQAAPTSYDKWPLITLLWLTGLHWWMMGSLMVGESRQMSERVKRQLPQSFFGRMFLTWFNPGPGTGYVFAVTSTFAVFFLVIILDSFSFAFWRGQGPGLVLDVFIFGTLVVAYLAGYLGVTRLLLYLLDRITITSVPLSAMMSLLLVVMGTAIPAVIHISMTQGRGGYVTPMVYMTNPFVMLEEATDGTSFLNDSDYVVGSGVVIVFGLCMFVINLFLSISEVQQTRVAMPERIVEDEKELHPELIEDGNAPTSPWDETD